jgi:hypothetical protein
MNMQARFEFTAKGNMPGGRYAKGADGRYIDAPTQLAYFYFCLGAESAIDALRDFMGASGLSDGRQYKAESQGPLSDSSEREAGKLPEALEPNHQGESS